VFSISSCCHNCHKLWNTISKKRKWFCWNYHCDEY